MNFEKAKSYSRIDTNAEDEEIQELVSAAEEYLSNAGIPPREGSALYDLAVKLLVSNWYENRCPVGQANPKMAYSLQHIMAQLALGAEDG